MGQKVNPHGFRVGVIKDWNSRWFTKDETFGDTLVSDYKIRKYLKEKYKEAGVPKVEIERSNAGRVKVYLHCAKPGFVIGRGGTEIEKIRLELEAMVGQPVSVDVMEVKNPDVNAQLVAESIAKQLEGRASFRRAMKMSIQRSMRMGAKGIKVTCSGRLAGAEIARTEHYHEGSIPLQTLRADIDYGFAEANTTYGKIGVKVWIYKGEVLRDSGKKQHFYEAKIEAPKQERRGDRRDRRNGGFNKDRQGGFNKDRQGGFNRDRQGGGRGGFGGSRQGGFNRDRQAGAESRQAAPAPKEGGDK